jgi:hypothetical protein
MPDTASQTRPAPTWDDNGSFPAIGTVHGMGVGYENVENLPHQQLENPSAVYYPVQTPQQSIPEWEYGSGLGELYENHEVDEFARSWDERDTDVMVSRPMFVNDYVRVIDYEIGGEAGKVNRNPYTIGPVVPFEDFDMTGVMARITRRPEGLGSTWDGPVKGLSVSQGSAWDAYAAQLAQSQYVLPSTDNIALNLLGLPAQYDEGYAL